MTCANRAKQAISYDKVVIGERVLFGLAYKPLEDLSSDLNASCPIIDGKKILRKCAMNNKYRISMDNLYIIIVLLLAIILPGCAANINKVESDEEKFNTEGGVAYEDKNLDLFVIIMGADWKYVRSNNGDQVLFYFLADTDGTNIISLQSMLSSSVDVETQISTIWKKINEFGDIKDWNETSIEVGKYQGKNFQFALREEKISCSIWATRTRTYVCVANLGEKHIDITEAAMNGIYKTFMTYEEFEKQKYK